MPRVGFPRVRMPIWMTSSGVGAVCGLGADWVRISFVDTKIPSRFALSDKQRATIGRRQPGTIANTSAGGNVVTRPAHDTICRRWTYRVDGWASTFKNMAAALLP